MARHISLWRHLWTTPYIPLYLVQGLKCYDHVKPDLFAFPTLVSLIYLDIFTFNVFFWPYCFFDLNLLFRLNHLDQMIKHISWEPLYQELPETFFDMQSKFCVEVSELVRVICLDRRVRSRLEPLIRWKRNRLRHSWKIRAQKLVKGFKFQKNSVEKYVTES